MPQITANGITLNYQFDGPEDQPVLLFSNSLASNLHMWDPQVPAVVGDFRVLRYDSRGHGGSDAPAADYTIDQLADDALALLDALEIEKVFYCGLSKGGMVGQKLASRNPDRLHAAVLCATSSYMGPPDLWQGASTPRAPKAWAVLSTPLWRVGSPSLSTKVIRTRLIKCAKWSWPRRWTVLSAAAGRFKGWISARIWAGSTYRCWSSPAARIQAPHPP